MRKYILCMIIAFTGTMATAQTKTITGTVTDQNALPLPGANIIVVGTKNSAQSDFDGNYSINAQQGQKLQFTYLGFKTEIIIVGSANVINVAMEEDSQSLEEVVVMAYSITRHKSTTGAVASVTSEKRRKKEAYHNSLAQQLSGQVSGVNITNNSGAAGSGTEVKIRGIAATRNVKTPRSGPEVNIRGLGTIRNGKTPLYIVDGTPIPSHQNNVIAQLPPDQVAKINVYKPGKAKQLFGSIAKNGCIVITTTSGTYEVQNDENYAKITENQFQKTHLNPLSTFSIDVDKAGYSNVRRLINNGQKVPLDAVKIEEMVNYFNYSYPQPKKHPFSINTETTATPWNASTKLVRIGLQGKEYKNEALPASNLTFLIDVSGSMSATNKLPLLKSAFKLLVNQLREKDKIAIVVYAGAAGVVLKPTSGANKEKIIAALDRLEAGGSTAGGAGIELAYSLAQQHFVKNGNNRVILATDGDFNVGASSNGAMKDLIEEKRKSGVFLSVLGFGMGNYKDDKLETLVDKGNGNHAYIDNMQEAQKVFGKEFGGTLYTIAKDVKIQLEFNPSKVQAYRLIGYENRLLADEDFIDDTKDAGELGSGHTVTALYEIVPVGVESDFIKEIPDLKYTTSTTSQRFSEELLTVKFRYKKPDGDKSIELVQVVNDETTAMSSDFKFASAVALFGMQLRKSQFTNSTKIEDVIALAEAGRGKDKQGYRAEFIRLVKASTSDL